MSTLVVGDVQGCYRTLRRLLAAADFDPARDRLWLVGDLVNRGPRSLKVLRWVRELGDAAVTVLGNHDLHLLAVAQKPERLRNTDTLKKVLRAPDREELIEWLARRPLLHVEGSSILTHAGLWPGWTVEQAQELAAEAASALRSSARAKVLSRLYEGQRVEWSPRLKKTRRIVSVLSILTRMRTCTADGRLCWRFSGPPDQAPAGCRPWFEFPHRRPKESRVFFGHWAALGFHRSDSAVCLESGCVWGREMTALRLDDERVFQHPNVDF